MKNYFIIIDMQNDFVTGALGSPMAQEILPTLVDEAKAARARGEELIFTRDTHTPDYLSTQEGKNLPVTHCVKNTEGWQLVPELLPLAEGADIFDKPTFGSVALSEYLVRKNEEEGIGSITLAGVCTDICVVSNALLIKAALPEVPVCVLRGATAGVRKESHEAALVTMASCQIEVK